MVRAISYFSRFRRYPTHVYGRIAESGVIHTSLPMVEWRDLR